MWYAIQVMAGRERITLRKIERIANPATYTRYIVPSREQKRRRNGEWETVHETLFPGYLLVKTKEPERFSQELQKVIDTTKLLKGRDENEEYLFIPISPYEEKLIIALMDEDVGVLHMSTGVIEGDQVMVMSGPLKGHEGLIKGIDRHKRAAYLEFIMFGRILNVKVGLEIVEKR